MLLLDGEVAVAGMEATFERGVSGLRFKRSPHRSNDYNQK